MHDSSRAEQLRTAARVRAAIAYSGLRTEQIVERMGGDPGVATLRRIASGTSPRGASLAELWRIADACDVPRAWLERGEWLEAAPQQALGKGSTAERLEVVERYLELIIRGEGVTLPLPPTPKRAQPNPPAQATRAGRRARSS